jgi:transcriptional regulator with PAS, ATPase and Fis domain
VQVAEGGTLFLDEIGEFPLSLQPKFLRFLQDREYERVGDPRTRTADVRLIAATNRDLATAVIEGTFRNDLYYRLNVIALTVPALRERPEDILTIANKLLTSLVARYRRPARRFTDTARNALLAYSWPGNVRELANAIERAVIVFRRGNRLRAPAVLDLRRRRRQPRQRHAPRRRSGHDRTARTRAHRSRTRRHADTRRRRQAPRDRRLDAVPQAQVLRTGLRAVTRDEWVGTRESRARHVPAC